MELQRGDGLTSERSAHFLVEHISFDVRDPTRTSITHCSFLRESYDVALEPRAREPWGHIFYRQKLLTMTKFLLTIAALAGSASAFAPAASVKSSTSLNEFAKGYFGAEGPEPIPFSSGQNSVAWDPVGLAEVGLAETLLLRNSHLI
jgi:hypothetical protein